MRKFRLVACVTVPELRTLFDRTERPLAIAAYPLYLRQVFLA